MSQTTIVAVWPNEKSECVEKLRNAWGSAPVVWNDMAVRYLDCRDNGYWSCQDKLWPLYKRNDIPLHHRAVLTMTYDNCYVKQEHYAKAAELIRMYLADFPPDPQHVHHWSRIAEIFESNPAYPAIGFWMTSVCENPFDGEWNDDVEEYEQPDWSKYWSVFDILESMN